MTFLSKIVILSPQITWAVQTVEMYFRKACFQKGREVVKLVQVTKFYIFFCDENPISESDFRKIMWEIQDQVRAFKNRASSEYFSFLEWSKEWKQEHGTYPKEQERYGHSLRNHFYHMATEMIPDLQTGNVSSISEDVFKRIKSKKVDILAGRVSIPSFKENQPIVFHNKSISIDEKKKDTDEGKKDRDKKEEDNIFLTLSVLSKVGTKKYGLKSGQFCLRVWHRCDSSISIIRRCISGEYKVCASSMKYDKKKKTWEFALAYQFEPEKSDLDPKRVLGIDLGIKIPIVAAIYGEKKCLFFRGGEIEHFRNTTEAMRRQMSRARVQAGGGSVGHGRRCRTKAMDRIGNRIANFRNTKNSAWAREIVNFAVKNHCGIIQMEDLTGIAAEPTPRFLKNWTYYDLQSKITYMAEAVGITVVKIDPQYTSQRCSYCGYIFKESRKDQEHFVCVKCKYTENADLNAARNIATPGIEEIIRKQREHQSDMKTP